MIKDEKPLLFQKTERNIWTDPYIQNQMLKEHLNLSSDGASRKENAIIKIIEFISQNTTPNSSILDLGCGPGLYTSILKDKGYSVTGIDMNKVSIDYAIKERNDIHYILDDYIKNYPIDSYDNIIMIYCDMGTHSNDDRDGLLRNIYNSLNSGGKLIFDVFTEELPTDKPETKSWDYAPGGGFWSEREYLLLSQVFHYPENRVFAYQYNLLANKEVKHYIVWEKYYSEEEITYVLEKAGFRKIQIHKNIAVANNFTSDKEMFIVAEKD